MSFRGQARWAKMTSPGDKLTALAHPHRCLKISRLLKFCFVPATSVPLPRAFLQGPLIVPTRQTSQAVCAMNQSIFLNVYAYHPTKKVDNAGELTYLSANIASGIYL